MFINGSFLVIYLHYLVSDLIIKPRRDIIMLTKSSGINLLFALITVVLFVSGVRAADDELPYKVIFKGISDKDLLSDIQSISDTFNNIDKEVASSYLLQKMADGDNRKFLQILRARGFYDASIESDINLKERSIELTFKFQTGAPYILKSVKLEFTHKPDETALKLPDIKRLGLYLDQPFSSQTVLDGQDNLIRFIRSKGFPFIKISDRDVVVDHKDQSVSVYFYIESGPKAFFGRTTISELVNVDKSYVAGKVLWKDGDIFNGDLIEETRKSISGLGLFASVRITEGKEIDEDSRISMTIEITERKHKSVSAGVNYITDEGPGTKISWENRNVFHHGEKLTTEIELSDYTMAAEAGFRKQDFLKLDQTIRFSLRLSKYHPEAYLSKSLVGSVFIDRDLTKKLRVGAGITLKSSKIEQLESIESYNLISLPIYCNRDTRNDLLDPVRGHRLSLELTPSYEPTGSRITFGKVLASYKRYNAISQKPFIIIAMDIKAGFIKGAGRDEIPADERLYAGGGGSIRGYSYQSVGPLLDGIPVGGKSLIETSIELRLKVTERFGLAAFLDGGSAFTDKLFSSEDPLRWGTGIGIRYYTPVGPLRLDVGIPLNKRQGVDDSYQIYISLGQAF
jgi:translocation and assembly module TamA